MPHAPTNAARAAFNAWCASASASLEQDYWRRQQQWESFLAGWIASQAPRRDAPAAATANPDHRRMTYAVSTTGAGGDNQERISDR